MKLARYRKAFAAAFSGLVSLAAIFIPGVEALAPPEVIAAASSIAATVLVYAVPNAP